MRKRADESNRSEVIMLRVRADEKEDIRRAAGGEMSEWLRGLAQREIERAEAERKKAAARRRRKRGKR